MKVFFVEPPHKIWEFLCISPVTSAFPLWSYFFIRRQFYLTSPFAQAKIWPIRLIGNGRQS